MEKENKNQIPKEIIIESDTKNTRFISIGALISIIILVGAWVYATGLKSGSAQQKTNIASNQEKTQPSVLEEEVLPSQGVVLPVAWGDLGKKLVNTGVIDADKFKAIYEQRGTFTEEYKTLLLGENMEKIKMTNENSGYILNLLWALGLGSKNPILETGEMSNPQYGGAGNFASTGGWTVSQGNAMDHYSKHKFFDLTSDQQALVEKVSKGIYRPCCGNSTHFPDCNHGMAMLGLLELMASQGVSEQDMWQTALAVNSYWFPNNYLTIATYMNGKGVDWKDVNPQEILGNNYSSSRGYANIASQITQPQQQKGGGNGCGIDAGVGVAPQQKGGSGCGLDSGSGSAPAPQRQQAGCGI